MIYVGIEKYKATEKEKLERNVWEVAFTEDGETIIKEEIRGEVEEVINRIEEMIDGQKATVCIDGMGATSEAIAFALATGKHTNIEIKKVNRITGKYWAETIAKQRAINGMKEE